VTEPAGIPALWRRAHALYSPIALVVPTLLLAYLGSGGNRPIALLLGVAGIGTSAYLRSLRTAWAVDLWVLPALLSSSAVVIAARVSLPTELLAAGVALLVLYWVADDRSGVRLPPVPVAGLLLPGLAVALALSVTLFLPAGPALVGVASAILVALFLGLAGALGIGSTPSSAE
jgi:hypothetical protein